MNFVEFKKNHEYKNVIENENYVSNKPTVSVSVITYQHASYIRECLDGILMQKTNFLFEILLGEDDSTDGTREICIDYANRYPDKIRLFLHHRENNIKIGGQPTGRFVVLYNLYSAQGKYIALCEGDDYWTDPLKLQKQVDFLELNEEFGLVFSNIDKLFSAENKFVMNSQKTDFKIGFTELMKFNPISTPTVMIRAKIVKDYLTNFGSVLNRWKMGDRPLWIYTSVNYKIKYMNESLAVYRILDQSATNTSLINKFKFKVSSLKMRWFFLFKHFKIHLFFHLTFESLKVVIVQSVKLFLNYFGLYKPDRNKLITKKCQNI